MSACPPLKGSELNKMKVLGWPSQSLEENPTVSCSHAAQWKQFLQKESGLDLFSVGANAGCQRSASESLGGSYVFTSGQAALDGFHSSHE